MPWQTSYLLPAVKWFPLVWPNEEWQVIPFPPTPGVAPQPPDGTIIPWWLMPKDQWPIAAPWGEKSFGLWPAAKISTPSQLQNHPPFGYIKLKVPGARQTSGNQISFMNMKIYMRPQIEHFSVLTRTNGFGEPKFYLIDKNWQYAEYDVQKYRSTMKEKWRDRLAGQVLHRITETKGKPGLITERLAAEIVKIGEKQST